MGLMGKKNPEPLFFTSRWGIHTFFLRFPIDVLILDDSNKIVVMREGLKPWQIFFWSIKYSRILELPQGTIHSLNLKLGGQIKIFPF